jgi:peptidyl-prolyl cis-trans isomerase SurA
MGFIAESALKADPLVYGALNKIKPGQFTEVLPISADGPSGHRVVGYAIYRLLSRDPAGQRELNDPRVQQAIHTTLHNNRVQLLENAYFEKLQNEAKIQNYLADEILKQGAK